jgi:hypothetical protein
MARARERIDAAAMAREEVAGADLGDVRLTKRLGTLIESLARNPSESLPNAMPGEAALEATYRFLGNERVSPDAILAPHVAQTRVRCEQRGRVLAVFDTTEVRLGGERLGLGHLSNQKGRGLLAHVGLTVDSENREPLGVVHCETLVRRGKKKQRKHALGAADSESLRWHRGVAAASELMPGAICVMDREADIFPLVAEMLERGQDFVIRAAQNRNTPEGPLWELLDDAELVTTRELELPERKPRKRKSARRLHPARSAHVAKLEIRARRVMLQAPQQMRNTATVRRGTLVEVNIVHVIEPEPPAGDVPVEWIILTSLSISTKRAVDFIVDAYRTRWVIEEFFKALKSGCGLETRQLESERSITNALAVSLPIAWLLLRLRHLSRDEPERPAVTVLSPLMMTCLRVLLLERTGRNLTARPTCKQLTWAIAALGGHIRNNGEPGFIVLGRGLAKLLAAAAVAAAMQKAAEM